MKQLLTFITIFSITVLGAQSIDKTVIAAAGSIYSTPETSISFTIGEPIVGLVGGDAFIDQGFWAGSEITVESLNEEEELDGILVYPNPVESELTIFTNNKEVYGITLFAVDGRRVLKQKVESTQLEHKIDLSYLSKGMYVLRLLTEGDGEKLFKIIKK